MPLLLKTAHPQKLSFIEKVKLNSYTMFSKQKGFASHNCLAFGKQRRKEMPAREGQTNRASVWGIVIQIHTVASKVQHGNYHKQWVIFSLNNVQNFFLIFLIFPVSQFRLIFLSKKKNKQRKNKNKDISMRGPACTKETGDIYLLLQPTSSVYTGGTKVCLGIPGSKHYHCIRHALCCFSFVILHAIHSVV